MISEKIAHILLDLEAVIVRPDQPFVFASGIKSPIYCDNRILISHAAEREFIVDSFLEVLHTSNIPCDVIVGTATAGIPWAAWLAQRLGKPMAYVRQSAKGHGKKNMIEGRIAAGQKVVVVEDLVSSGESSLHTIASVQAQGALVTACVAIFTYQMRQVQQRFSDVQVPLYALCGLADLVDYASAHNFMSHDHKGMVLEWARDPKTWADKYVV